MAFIGNQPALAYTSFAVQHFTTSATTSYTLNYPVANENEIRLVINNVVQQPGSSYAYTASGTSLTLSAATTATDTMYAVFLGKAVQTVNPPNGSVGTSQLADGAVTSAKIASGAVVQVVNATDTTQRSTTSTSFVTASSTLSINITPSSTSNKIFLIASFYSYQSATATLATFFRDSTNVANTNGLGRFVSNAGAFDGQINISFLDSPSTTSSINYTVRIKTNGGGTSYLGDNTETATFTAFEIKG